MDLATAAQRFLDHRRGRGLAASSLTLYERQLGDWRDWRSSRGHPPELAAVTLDELDAFFTYLARDHVAHGDNPRRPAATAPGLAPATVAGIRRTLKAFWGFAEARGWLDTSQLGFFGRDGVPIPRVKPTPRPTYAEDQLGAMLAACGPGEDETSARDRALVALLWESGARIAELLGLDDGDLDVRRRRGRVRGKGGAERRIRWGALAQVELLKYLQRRRGSLGGPVFRATGPRAGSARRLTTDNARARFRRQLEAAGIDPAPGSPFHAFRRGWIQRGLKRISLAHVAQLAGHRDVRTTMIYAQLDEDALDERYRAGYG
jgi:site-specific recombinase XerD